jgi:hypothetical protein
MGQREHIADAQAPKARLAGEGQPPLVLVALKPLLGEALGLPVRLNQREVDALDAVDAVNAGQADFGEVDRLIQAASDGSILRPRMMLNVWWRSGV